MAARKRAANVGDRNKRWASRQGLSAKTQQAGEINAEIAVPPLPPEAYLKRAISWWWRRGQGLAPDRNYQSPRISNPPHTYHGFINLWQDCFV